MKFILTFLFFCGVSGQTFKSNGYEDLVVAIHPDVSVSSDHQQIIVDNLKVWIGEGSKRLFDATEKYAYIKSVSILLPTTWTDVPADPVSGVSYEDGVIRVDKPNPLYEDGPYTLQPGGCGDRGEFIHVTPNFIINLNTTSTQDFGPPEKVFVHEFAKLRYGVFEEFGYPGDSQYPMFYYEQSYVDGTLVSTLTPNFCTDAPLQGNREDFVDGGSCKFDPQTNLPDEHCSFIPGGNNSVIRSSYMSLPSLENMNKFCRDTETVFAHNPYRPNKHNAMCEQKSTWSVIIANPDFIGVTPMDAEYPPETTFKILRPQEERFVFVLDVSGSMADANRIGRLIQSSNRWVKYEVRDGSQVGVTSFSSNVNTVQPLTAIINDDVRDAITRKIDTLKANGGTCLGAGLKNGMNVLNGVGDTSSGGVILFVTDGRQDCTGPDKTTLDDSALLQRVKDSKVRIITIAFGTTTDPNLENLAVVSGGKTYFVPDGTGIEDINDAFEGSLTFQPAVPSGEVDIVVFSEVYKNVKGNLTGAFVIDKTVGRKAKFQMDYIVGESSDIEKISLIFGNGSVYEYSNSQKSPFIAKFDLLEEGEYKFIVSAKVGKTLNYLNVVVSAKAAADDMLPFHTKCWLSTGNAEVDMSNKKLSILARVSQGNRPVLNAKVQAFIEDGSQPLPLTLDLFDNGAGADVIANDGVYSRYFVKYDGKNGDYTLRCQVKGDENTNFVAQKAETFYDRIRRTIFPRAFPIHVSPTSPICCGSNADSSQMKKEPTGIFERKVTGTSFTLTNVPTTDIFPPSKVTDLRAKQFQSEVEITFTAPGDNYDEGNATRYDIRFSENMTDFYNETLWDELESITEDDLISGTLDPVDAGSVVVFRVSKDHFPSTNDIYFLSMKSYDKQNLTSPISSPFQLKTYPYEEPDDGLSGGAIAGIVIGVLLAVLIVVVVAYLIVKKRK